MIIILSSDVDVEENQSLNDENVTAVVKKAGILALYWCISTKTCPLARSRTIYLLEIRDGQNNRLRGNLRKGIGRGTHCALEAVFLCTRRREPLGQHLQDDQVNGKKPGGRPTSNRLETILRSHRSAPCAEKNRGKSACRVAPTALDAESASDIAWLHATARDGGHPL
ncbi:hypothetical protein EVAR_28178_1 [Eumeta japonica]|uniref:Uncharacterized protein n=1 Tax=Eumeta variegata TaxID=151549 RepID=A0A4C1VI95_EUMVA|nr:hypothetical protein EVAR_28178_1 [Eumeta japonica]